MRKTFKLMIVMLLTSALSAQNPIVPAGVYIADPSAHVWKDEKIYVYGSKDESANYYCSWEHHVLSSSDMKNWEITRRSFASKGDDDQVPFSDEFLYAPDCQFKNGVWYLYFCLSNREEGVATSSSPTGPFRDGKKIDLKGKNGIDPCVFIDDDGQGYYIWGQFSAKMAKLKPNMLEIDTATIRDGVVTERDHFFHEGAYLIKRNGIYYLVYADVSRAGQPTCIGYATATNPFGPYTYRGVIIDNSFCDPSNWNNHGSLVEFNGQWYVFYHRTTHKTVSMRKACVEPIYFNADGTIKEVEMTTQGAAQPIDARKKMDAERACLLFGQTYIKACAPDNEMLVNIHSGDKVAYKYLDFGNGVDSLIMHLKPGWNGGHIAFSLDYGWYHLFGFDIPARMETGGMITIRKKLDKPLKGVHALWLSFSGRGNDLFELDWFQFK